MKIRNLGIILSLAFFLAAQALGIAHAAEYGPGKHKHHGHVCDIYLSTDQAKSSPPLLPLLFPSEYNDVVFIVNVSVALSGGKYSAALPRAPPATLPI